jgi:aminomethyltransferase
VPNATPLIEVHRARGARLVDFAGWEMPIQYTGIVDEHRRVRRAVGLFDVSHMGRFEVRGDEAAAFLDRMVTNGVAVLPIGKAVYSPLCRPDGGILDDLLIYRFPDHFLVVVNAANTAKDWAWLAEHATPGVTLADRTAETALIAVQGPRAEDLVARVVGEEARSLGYYTCTPATVPSLSDVRVLVGRTGYTGEDGFEIASPAEVARDLWEALESMGRDLEVGPAGLGARDTLRLEMGFCLYGNDIDETTTPVQAGLGWTVRWDKPDFVGREALVAERTRGPERKLVGFLAADSRAIPRHGATVSDGEGGEPLGTVTSGTYGPSLERAVGMAYVRSDHTKIGTVLSAQVRDRQVNVEVVKRPFYQGASHK